MPPKAATPPKLQSDGFVAKQEDFLALSPSVGGSGSDTSADRTARLEHIVVNLVEGQQQLTRQISDLADSVRNSRFVSGGSPSDPAVDRPPRVLVAAQQQQRCFPSAAGQQPSFVDHRRYANVLAPGFESTQPPPLSPSRPHLFAIENDTTFRTLSTSKFKGALEEYQLLVCHGFFLSCAVASQADTVASIQAAGYEDLVLRVEEELNTFAAIEQAFRQRIHYIRLAKGQAKLSSSDQLFAEHLRTAFQPAPFHLGCPETAALYEQFRAREIEMSLAAAAKAAAGKKFTSSVPSSSESSSSHKNPGKTAGKSRSKDKGKAKEDNSPDC